MFALALAGYLIVAVLLERYDNDNGGNTLWAYTALLWLVLAVAQRGGLVANLRTLAGGTNAPGPVPDRK